jgi:hypothetical protein
MVALQKIGWLTAEGPAPIQEKDSILPAALGSAMSVGEQPTGVSVVLRNADPDGPLAGPLLKALSGAFGMGNAGRNEKLPDDFFIIVIAPQL